MASSKTCSKPWRCYISAACIKGWTYSRGCLSVCCAASQAAAAGDADALNYLGYFYWMGAEEGDNSSSSSSNSSPNNSSSSSNDTSSSNSSDINRSSNDNSSSSSNSSSSNSSKGTGFVLKRDLSKAEMFFAKAALQEHPEAFYFLGEIRQQQAAAAATEAEKQKAGCVSLSLKVVTPNLTSKARVSVSCLFPLLRHLSVSSSEVTAALISVSAKP
ncbi:hypothetical protein Emed_004391 [Eimeria media]